MSPPEDTVTREPSEAACADRLRAGDADALALLFDRHAERIHQHCFRLTGDRADAEDATASTFLEIWRHRERVVVHDGSALPWVYGVATNVCRNLTRGRRRHLRAVARHQPPPVTADHADDVVDRVDAAQQVRRVLAAVQRLPRRERDVLALVVWSDLGYAEAAIALDVPIGTVRSRLSRARRRLSLDVPDPTHPEGTPS